MDNGNIAAAGAANGSLRHTIPILVIELRLKMRDRGVDAADLGNTARVRSAGGLGGGQDARHCLVLDCLSCALKLRVAFPMQAWIRRDAFLL